MDSVNFALLSVLYDNGRVQGNFYHEIYYPVIKHSLVLWKRKSNAKDCPISDLQEIIKDEFGLEIPYIILKQVIKKMSQGESGFKIRLCKDERSFQVDPSLDQDIDDVIERSKFTEKELQELEIRYKDFLSSCHVRQDHSFSEFLSLHLKDVLEYFSERQPSEYINEVFSPTAKFIENLKKSDDQQHKIVSSLIWGGNCCGIFEKR